MTNVACPPSLDVNEMGVRSLVQSKNFFFFFCRGFYTSKYAKFSVRETSRLLRSRRFHQSRVFAHGVSKMPSRRTREDAKTRKRLCLPSSGLTYFKFVLPTAKGKSAYVFLTSGSRDTRFFYQRLRAHVTLSFRFAMPMGTMGKLCLLKGALPNCEWL